jgi:patatin-like phospholipase/acyl hydrolase
MRMSKITKGLTLNLKFQKIPKKKIIKLLKKNFCKAYFLLDIKKKILVYFYLTCGFQKVSKVALVNT